MNEMVERVARAIEVRYRQDDSEWLGARCIKSSDESWKDFVGDARAAIAAINAWENEQRAAQVKRLDAALEPAP